jgi:transketolase
VVAPDYEFVPGRMLRIRDGADVLLVATGQQTARTLAAAELLAAQGIDAGVVHVPCLKPVDTVALADACAGAPLVVTTEEHTVIGGLGSLVAEVVTGADPRRVERIGIDDAWGESAPGAWLLTRFGLMAEQVAERVRGALEAGARAGEEKR